MLEVLIFDLGKVLIDFDYDRALKLLEDKSPWSAQEIRQRVLNWPVVREFERGRFTGQQFYSLLRQRISLRASYEEFCELWSAIFLPEPLIPEDFLAALHRRYRMLILSNTNEIHFEMIRRKYSLLKHFDDYVLSYQVGSLKPEPEIYQAALERAKTRPQRCFFTDDNPINVQAARELGIDAVTFESFEKLKDDLRKRGVDSFGMLAGAQPASN